MYRRRFLRFLAGSPLLAAAQESPEIKHLLNVMEFEEAARRALPPAHFGYLNTGVDDDLTVRANREAYSRIQLRPRRLVDVRTVDTRIELLGASWDHPIALAPCGSQAAFHAEGEIATARGAAAQHAQILLSTVSTRGVEDVARTAGRPVWFQLYATSKWEVTQQLVRRAENAGCPVLVLTVDRPAPRNTETQERMRRTDTRKCAACHTPAPRGIVRRPMFDGIDMTGVTLANPGMTWSFVRKLRDSTRMKLLIKGIETREDALLCREHGVDGIIVSNHGGRAEESSRPTIDSLPEVVDAVGGRMPVLVDGGIRRGTDVFKALALGARAICIGRPYLWGLGAFGAPGVERVIQILRAEFELAMRQCGTRSVAEIGPPFVRRGRVDA